MAVEFSDAVKLMDLPSNTFGMISSSGAADWDSDGIIDLLIGNEDGNIRFFKNIGTRTDPQFDNSNAIKLMADGEIIALTGGGS